MGILYDSAILESIVKRLGCRCIVCGEFIFTQNELSFKSESPLHVSCEGE